jgi:energy-coupling factor transporter ATP-binding protein EcfA2
MKIKTMKIENYRCFQDEMFSLNRYSCFVGPNGSGKSSILNALNVFFREQASTTTDMSKLTEEDYFYKDTSIPIRITVTFDDLSETAQTELADYVRQNELVVTVEAVFNSDLGYGQTKYYGLRLGMGEFRPFFDALKAGARAEELTTTFEALRQQYPELLNPRSKDDKAEALRTYESAHPDSCVLIPSEDNFYGINSTGKLANFVQWIFVPAVKEHSAGGHQT